MEKMARQGNRHDPDRQSECNNTEFNMQGTFHSESWDYAWSSIKSDDHREKTIVIITEPTIQSTVNKQINTATG